MNMDAICGWFGVSRQAHYQMQRRLAKQRQQEEAVLAQVRAIRQQHPRLGGRKLHYKVRGPLAEQGIHLGRDRLFELLRGQDLLIKRRRRSRRTTWAGSWRTPNLLAGLVVTHPNQVWVSDITYIETEQGSCYLFLITDLYSRRIMGWHVSVSLATEGALAALCLAVDTAGRVVKGLIHHSDHGVQYTCGPYRQGLQDILAQSSMGQVGNCYENAHAERVNGILKLEYGLDARFLDLDQVRQHVQQAVLLYNSERPHLALQYRTPLQVYQQPVADLAFVIPPQPLAPSLSAKGSWSRNGSAVCSPSPGGMLVAASRS